MIEAKGAGKDLITNAHRVSTFINFNISISVSSAF